MYVYIHIHTHIYIYIYEYWKLLLTRLAWRMGLWPAVWIRFSTFSFQAYTTTYRGNRWVCIADLHLAELTQVGLTIRRGREEDTSMIWTRHLWKIESRMLYRGWAISLQRHFGISSISHCGKEVGKGRSRTVGAKFSSQYFWKDKSFYFRYRWEYLEGKYYVINKYGQRKSTKRRAPSPRDQAFSSGQPYILTIWLEQIRTQWYVEMGALVSSKNSGTYCFHSMNTS